MLQMYNNDSFDFNQPKDLIKIIDFVEPKLVQPQYAWR
jgi:hypothetical protein